ncbi:organic cation [Stylonychia lemnae]|uniref:Organic cation n=1 Tax=Stylonychia lemnae TaxID=5949 RepID=A0A077ZUG1_STYLE|nr:organic cation [Stylonychia lemnae]|eukprot:CDW73543.1 organic cation [Stylonychia lemnae]
MDKFDSRNLEQSPDGKDQNQSILELQVLNENLIQKDNKLDDKHQEKSFNVSKLLEPQQIIDMIPFGRYQLFLAALYFANFITNSFLCYNYSYLLILPQYKCLNQTTNLYENCENEYICQTLNQQQRGKLWFVDYQDVLSMDNWIDRLQMHCSEGYLIGLFGSMEFIGTSIAALIFPPLADTYGRKYFSYVSMWLTVPVMLILLIFRNNHIYYVALTLNGVCIGLKQFIFYTHIMEFMGLKTSIVSGLFFFVDGAVFTVSPIILYFITRNTQVFVYIGLSLSLITIFISHTYLRIPESIKFNLIKNNYSQLNEDIRNIMSFNNTPEDIQKRVMIELQIYEDSQTLIKQNEINLIQQQKEQGLLDQKIMLSQKQNSSKSLFDTLLDTKHAVYNLIMISVGWITSTFIFSLLDFFVKYLPGNIYVNQLVASLSMFGYLIAQPVAAISNNKISLLASFIASLGAVFIMTCVHNLNQYVFAFIFLLFKTALCMSLSAMYSIHLDLFPTQLLTSSYGICNFVCRLCSLLAPQLAELHNRLIPMYAMIAQCIAAIITTVFIKVSYSQTSK